MYPTHDRTSGNANNAPTLQRISVLQWTSRYSLRAKYTGEASGKVSTQGEHYRERSTFVHNLLQFTTIREKCPTKIRHLSLVNPAVFCNPVQSKDSTLTSTAQMHQRCVKPVRAHRESKVKHVNWNYGCCNHRYRYRDVRRTIGRCGDDTPLNRAGSRPRRTTDRAMGGLDVSLSKRRQGAAPPLLTARPQIDNR